MAALTGPADLQHKGNLDGYKLSVKCVGADTFYRGALVYGDAASGKAQVVPATGGATNTTDRFIGICAKTVTTTAADQMVEIYVGGLWGMLNTTTVVAGDEGDVLIMDIGTTQTDNPADLVTGVAATTAATDILIGKIIAVDANDAARCWVRIYPGYVYNATVGWD